MTAIFVTATGTEIGKTFVAGGLIRHLRGAGRSVEAIKPVVTGFDPANAAESDPGVLLAALGRPVDLQEIAKISPWRYRAALSPDMAAVNADAALDFAAVVEFSRRAIVVRRDALLIEGAGGVMTPLDRTHTMLDWMAALQLPLIVVAGTYLGTISHTLTALDVLRRRGLKVLCLIVNETAGSTVSRDDTAATIARFSHPTRVVAMPRARKDELASVFAQIWAAHRRDRGDGSP